MRRWIDIFRPLLTILLILQVSAAHALPAGIHLNLCFGSDGHFDISPDLCTVSPLTPPFPQSDTGIFSEAPHGDCLDVEIGCVSSDEQHPPIAKVCPAKTKAQRNNSPLATKNHTLSFSHQTFQSSIRTPSHLNDGPVPPSHLISLRTIVLLI